MMETSQALLHVTHLLPPSKNFHHFQQAKNRKGSGENRSQNIPQHQNKRAAASPWEATFSILQSVLSLCDASIFIKIISKRPPDYKSQEPPLLSFHNLTKLFTNIFCSMFDGLTPQF
jgi:hypothetical protein